MTSVPMTYASSFSNSGFWSKVGTACGSAGKKVIKTAVTLYYTLRDSDTPLWARTAIIGALGYFIYPFDAIPDAAPVVGYTDDAAVLALAFATVAMHVKDEHVAAAKKKIRQWFG